jgi:hypothetical protein
VVVTKAMPDYLHGNGLAENTGAGKQNDFTATINWGDGTTSTGIVSGANAAFSVSGSRIYTAAGQDSVIVGAPIRQAA